MSRKSGSPSRAGLLGAVEHGDLSDRLGQRLDQLASRERAVQADLGHSDSLAAADEVLDRLARGLAARAHDHDHALGLGMPRVVDQAVATAGALGQLVHRLLDQRRHAGVEGVGGLARLEERVGVVRGARG